jgi:hypothetical protein
MYYRFFYGGTCFSHALTPGDPETIRRQNMVLVAASAQYAVYMGPGHLMERAGAGPEGLNTTGCSRGVMQDRHATARRFF